MVGCCTGLKNRVRATPEISPVMLTGSMAQRMQPPRCVHGNRETGAMLNNTRCGAARVVTHRAPSSPLTPGPSLAQTPPAQTPPSAALFPPHPTTAGRETARAARSPRTAYSGCETAPQRRARPPPVRTPVHTHARGQSQHTRTPVNTHAHTDTNTQSQSYVVTLTATVIAAGTATATATTTRAHVHCITASVVSGKHLHAANSSRKRRVVLR